MSLATSGVGGAGGGAGMSMAAMAHGGPSALSTHQQTSSGGQAGGPPPGTTAPPPNMAGMAADLLDKNQNLGWKMIKNLAGMPIVSIDLYGDTGEVSYFPPVEDGEDVGIAVKSVGKVSATGTSLALKKDSDSAHKALKRLITKSKGYDAVFDETLSNDGKGEGIITIATPHLLLGERQVKNLHSATSKKYTIGEESSHAIDEDQTNGITIRNGNLDGSTEALGNDFDRITLGMNIHSKKKTLSLLPEEAVGIVLAKAKKVVAKSFPDLSAEDDDENYVDFPTSIALPAWACNHFAIESLMDACDGNAVLYNRSVAAIAGAFLPKFVKTKEGKTGLQPAKLYSVAMERLQAHQKKIQLAQQRKESVPNTSFLPLVIMAGMTEDGLEITAIQLKNPNASFGRDEYHCPFGELRVISTVSYQHSKPVSIVDKALVELSDIVDEVYPELEDDGGVTAVVTYGTIAKQLQLKDAMLKSLNGIKGDDVWNTKMNFLSTQEDIVSVGASILAGISHNRISPESSDDGKASRPAIMVKNVSPCAVGIAYSFNGGKKGTWTDPKVIFDYDRRVPAGPYNVEFSAAECVALKNDASLLNDMEKLVEESEKWLKGKHNTLREEAALGLSIKIVQRFERNGKWRDSGYNATPLTQGKDETEEDGNGDETEGKIAIETSTLELTLDPVGFMSMTLSTDGKTIDQAVKAARSSTFWYYFRIIAAILFFGGFMLKSYVDERMRENCAARVLAFYKRAAPNSINDGDMHHAHYTCYKYRGKTEKLYKKLERKYGIPVKEVHEWEDEEEKEQEESEEQQEENLDEKNGEL